MADLVGLLAAVDDRAPGDAGALVLEDRAGRELGTVFVEDRRVCWAVVPGRGRRLVDLLRVERGIPEADLESALTACRELDRPLGELLVERGVVSEPGLRSALKQHTVESLIAACDGSPEPVTWVRHGGRGYEPRFTFTPAELLLATSSALYPVEASNLDLNLEIAGPLGAAVVVGAFAIGEAGETACVWGSWSADLPARVLALAELGDWSSAALDASHGFTPAVIARVLSQGETVAVGWRVGRRLVYAAVLASAAAARLVDDLTRLCHPVVASSLWGAVTMTRMQGGKGVWCITNGGKTNE